MSSRSTLKLDLKDLSPRQATPHIGRLGLVFISIAAMVSTVASINSPSASTAMIVHYDKVKTEDLIVTVKPATTADLISGVTPQIKTRIEPQSDLVVPEVIQSSGTESGQEEAELTYARHTANRPVSSNLNDENRRVRSAPGSYAPEGMDVAIEMSNPSESVVVTRPRIHLAMLAPSMHHGPVVNLVESQPVAAAIVRQEPDDLGLPLEPNTDSEEAAASEPETAPQTSENSQSGQLTAAASEQASPVAIQPAAQSTAERIEVALAKPASETSAAAIDTLIAAPASAPDTTIAEKVSPAEQPWHDEKVKKKDTLSQIFNRLGISSKEAFAIARLKEAKPLMRIRPGQTISVQKSSREEGKTRFQLDALRFSVNKFDTLIINRVDDGYSVETETREPVIEYRTAGAEIQGSLLGAAKRAAIPRDIIYSLATIFGWKVDFAKHIQPGDKFSLIYEEKLLDDEVVGFGQIVAAELTTGDRTLRAVRHIDEDNRVTYYTPEGEGLQGSFLRSPIKFARVTSKFSKKRLHPILKTWKAHKGVDYGAPMNTPIRATGDGVVKYVGKKKGYGKTVILTHGDKYQTLYAHMNKFKKGMKSGTRVKQGDIIGYVGKTGWATGPHLHYEFRVHGREKNPLTVELPSSLPIDKKYRAEFLADASRWVNNLERNSRIALAENKQQ